MAHKYFQGLDYIWLETKIDKVNGEMSKRDVINVQINEFFLSSKFVVVPINIHNV